MVSKRDGTVEPFEYEKVRRCIVLVMRECRYDDRYAVPLAQAVAAHLNEEVRGRPVAAEYIYRCVRAVMQETGLRDAAERLSDHRRQRSIGRQRVSVTNVRAPGRQAVAWRKASIVATLERRHKLQRTVARILAGQIEHHVLAMSYGVVSTTLVAELIRSELSAWGLSDDACTGSVHRKQRGMGSVPRQVRGDGARPSAPDVNG